MPNMNLQASVNKALTQSNALLTAKGQADFAFLAEVAQNKNSDIDSRNTDSNSREMLMFDTNQCFVLGYN